MEKDEISGCSDGGDGDGGFQQHKSNTKKRTNNNDDQDIVSSNPEPKKKRKMKLIVESYEKECTSGLLVLPNELFMHIFSYLVGDIMCKIDVSSIDASQDCKDDQCPLHAQTRALIPPFDNLKSIIRLSLVCRDFYAMINGLKNNEPTMKDFEMFWLRGFNFYFKLLYWIRTRKLEGMILAQGDLTQKDYIENAKAQNTILHYERGKSLKTFVDTFDYYNDDSDLEMDADDEANHLIIDENENESNSKTNIDNETSIKEEECKLYKKIFKSRKPIYNNPQQSKDQILKRFKQLEINWRQYIQYFRKDETSFQLCFDVMVMISLEMFDAFDSEETELYESGSGILISENYLNCWGSGGKRTLSQIELGGMESQKLGISITNCGGFAKFLTNSSEELNTDKIINLDTSKVDMSNFVKQLSKSIFLNLENVIIFKPLKNFTFPPNIKFLSIDVNSSESYSDYPIEELNEIFCGGDISFPGVKYLRMRYEQSGFHVSRVVFEDLEKKLLQFATNKKIFPNLRYLSLNGFSLSDDCLDREFLKQLIGFEISFNNDCRENQIWNEFRKITMELSKVSCCLRHVILETEIDSRCFSNLSTLLEKLYNNYKKAFSVGYASVSHFYAICGE